MQSAVSSSAELVTCDLIGVEWFTSKIDEAPASFRIQRLIVDPDAVFPLLVLRRWDPINP
jgi:hypothetical protein